jgi:hypothetical protein
VHFAATQARWKAELFAADEVVEFLDLQSFKSFYQKYCAKFENHCISINIADNMFIFALFL